MKRYEYLHRVSFEETNLIGNVYFANYLKWQGICRERFLEEKTPAVLDDIRNGMALVTLACSCNYYNELQAFDKVLVCMYLSELRQNKVKMRFEYLKLNTGKPQLVAEGIHEIGFFLRKDLNMVPIKVPAYLEEQLGEYAI